MKGHIYTNEKWGSANLHRLEKEEDRTAVHRFNLLKLKWVLLKKIYYAFAFFCVCVISRHKGNLEDRK